MKYIVLKASIILCVVTLVYSSHKESDNAKNQVSADFESHFCDTLIIFDLSKNVTSKDVFEITIKKFLKYIRQFCQKFKYTVMDESGVDGRNIHINECGENQRTCEEDILLMDYDNITLFYTDERYESTSNLSKNYFQFLNATLSTISPCANYSILLLTNRIVFMNTNDDFIRLFETLSIKLTTIHLGRNNTISTMVLEPAYANFPNTKTLNFANFDCLNYLMYCILPCANDTIECVAVDVDDCHHFSKYTPNDNPDQTLHIWFVEAFTESGTDKFDVILDNIVQGMQEYVDTSGIQHIRFQFISAEADNSSPCEGIDSIEGDCDIGTEHIDIDHSPIGNDDGSTNVRLSLIPWSNTLTKTRTGILSVIILTDFATPNLVIFDGHENLHAQMYVYNSKAFKYYSKKYANATNLYISSLDWSDVVTIIPLENGGFFPSPSSSIPTFTTFESTETTEINTFSPLSSVRTSTTIHETTYTSEISTPSPTSIGIATTHDNTEINNSSRSSSIPFSTAFGKTLPAELTSSSSDSQTLQFTEIITKTIVSVISSTTSSSKNSVRKNEHGSLQCFKYFISSVLLIRYFFP